MPQTRASETRRRILDSAIKLFTTVGYVETSLNDIVRHAHVTTGAFYYHFESKDAVAATIVEESWPRVLALADDHLGRESPGLQNIIVLSFVIASTLGDEGSLWLPYDLDYRIGQPPITAGPGFAQRHSVLIDRFATALRNTALQDGVTPEQAAATILAVHYGVISTAQHRSNRPPASALQGPLPRLAMMWPILLRGIVPPSSLPDLLQFVEMTAGRYQPLDA